MSSRYNEKLILDDTVKTPKHSGALYFVDTLTYRGIEISSCV